MFYVYIHTTPSGEIFYVGKGSGYRHWCDSLSHRSLWWHNKVRKHGGFATRVVFVGTEQECLDEEVRLIARHRAAGAELVNLTDGGDGTAGFVLSPEALERGRAARTGLKREGRALQRIQTGRAAWWAALTDEAKQQWHRKMAAGRPGRKKSPEHRAAIAAAVRRSWEKRKGESLVHANG